VRLLEAIIDANHRALAGDADAGLHPADFEDELPLVALTCIDVRLNTILPQVLGVSPEHFIWLRNAGNIITGPMSSTMRSLALACAVKGGKEILIIGHTDCVVAKTTTMQLLERLRATGVERYQLPDNLNQYFGLFSSERQNVLNAAEVARNSPLIGAKIPVHGLLVDVATGSLEWLVNGYQTFQTTSARLDQLVKSAGETVDAFKPLTDFKIGEMKFPETKIGEVVVNAENSVSEKLHASESNPPSLTSSPPVPPTPPRIPLPPPIRPHLVVRRAPKR
jgi:carbonic anhydrase